MQAKLVLNLLIFCAFKSLHSQNDTLNSIDSLGKKQGHWMVKGKDKPNTCYTSNQTIETGFYKDGRKTGIWKEYFCNGNLKNELVFENGRPSGPAKMYYENGKIQESGMWQNNRWVGEHLLYFDNGQIQMKKFYNEKGKRDGKQFYYFESGKIAIIDYTKDGKSDSSKNYFESGKIEGISYYKNDKCDSCKTYFEDGKTEKVFYRDSIKIIYNAKGEIAFSFDCKKVECDCKANFSATTPNVVQNYNTTLYNEYQNYNTTGFFYHYHGNGKVSFKAEYKNGRMYQERFCYDYYGNLINGKFTFYKMAKLKEREGFCINGKPEGESKVYDKDGNVGIKVNYHNGKPDGNTYYYYKNKLYLTETYKDGIFVKEIREKTETDGPIKVNEYNEFPGIILNGKQTLYNSKKQTTKEGVFKDNKLQHGKVYFYDDEGNLKRTEVYQNALIIDVIEK